MPKARDEKYTWQTTILPGFSESPPQSLLSQKQFRLCPDRNRTALLCTSLLPEQKENINRCKNVETQRSHTELSQNKMQKEGRRSNMHILNSVFTEINFKKYIYIWSWGWVSQTLTVAVFIYIIYCSFFCCQTGLYDLICSVSFFNIHLLGLLSV